MSTFKGLVMVAALLLSGSQLARAQAICADSNEFSGRELSYLVLTATSTDSATIASRGAQGIPGGPATEVELVRDAVVCAQAGAAYAQAERDSVLTGGRASQPGDAGLGNVVHVFRVADRYIVADERNMAGEYTIAWVFDQAFATPLKRLGL